MIEALKIVEIPPKKLVGFSTETSAAKPKTHSIWSRLMPHRNNIPGRIGEDLFSVQIYPPGLQMLDFTPETVFRSWAAVEVEDFGPIPPEFERHSLSGGLYAVFLHKGAVKTFEETAVKIYGEWIPNSEYELDEREHFEILGAKFLGPEHPDSEEEVWIPLRKH